jgi:uncharacterized membrane protein YqiK
MDNYEVALARIRRLGPVAMLILILLIALAIVFALSVVKIDGDQVGLVEKKLGGGPLPQGRILAVKGENGIQAQVLTPGWHFFYWPWQYDVSKVLVTEIKQDHVGLLTAADGRSLPPDTIYAPEWETPDKMIDAKYFLDEGGGYKGPQLTVLKPGQYRLNTKLFSVTQVPVTNVEIGTVAVVKSNVGEIAESADRLVAKSQRGVWNTPLSEGKYYLNTNAYEITKVSIRQVKVSYTMELERGEAETQERQPISVRSKDGFTFPVDVRVSYRIDRENAPRVVATIGGDAFVLSKLVTPTVRAIFRNNAEQVKALDYVQNRSVQEQQSASMLEKELSEYGVTVLAVRIGDVGDEKTLGALLKTQTDREIALQEQATFEEQQRAAEKQKALESTRQEAEEEKRLATAAYGVKVAEQEKQKIIIDAQAEAEQVKLVAEAKAQAYKMVSEVIGADNVALLEIMKLVATEGITITPDVMVGGPGGGITDALMGTILKDMLNKQPASEK